MFTDYKATNVQVSLKTTSMEKMEATFLSVSKPFKEKLFQTGHCLLFEGRAVNFSFNCTLFNDCGFDWHAMLLVLLCSEESLFQAERLKITKKTWAHSDVSLYIVDKSPFPTCPSTLVSPEGPGWLCCPVLKKPDLLIDPSERLHLSPAVCPRSSPPLLSFWNSSQS